MRPHRRNLDESPRRRYPHDMSKLSITRRGACLLAFSLLFVPQLQAAERKETPDAGFRRMVLEGRPQTPLKPEQLSEKKIGQMIVERVRLQMEPGEDAIALIYRPPQAGKHPAVVVQHFLGGSKDHFLFGPLMAGLAQRGYLVAAIDGRHRGERQRGRTLEAAMVEALKSGRGRPFLIDTVYDVTRLLDYLQQRPDVDGSRIGMTGISEGGIITWMTAAIDPRIKVAVPMIGVTSFGEALHQAEGPDVAMRLKTFEAVLSEYARQIGEPAVNARVLRLAWERLVPGMLDIYDAPAMLPLLAPRPLLILNHELDELMPLEGARKAYAAARAAYEKAGAADRIDFRIAANQRHAGFDLAEISAMMAWFDRFLKNPAS